ncbi:hypothetical protein EDB89DRAFT_1941999 [Lactarius sanguifluus]|nr:hypothetical protein EDB89DRAFT_1941999 [Lactarius sanguifluus]
MILWAHSSSTMMGLTLSRITNWPNMTHAERERTFRVLAARNQIRMANQDQEQQTSSATPIVSASASAPSLRGSVEE